MDLYKLLEQEGLVPESQWPVPDADFQQKIDRVEEAVRHDFAIEALYQEEVANAYMDGERSGSRRACSRFADALGTTDTDIDVLCRLARAPK